MHSAQNNDSSFTPRDELYLGPLTTYPGALAFQIRITLQPRANDKVIRIRTLLP